MSTVCAFSARRVRITSDTFIDSNSSLQFTTQPVAERISPSVNNVRFACAGFASRPGLPGFIESVILEITTKATFRFEPAEPSRFIANAHFVPLGTVSLTARAGGFLQSAGSAHFFLSGRVSTRVRAASGETVFRFVSDFETLFDFHAQGGDVAETTSEIVSSELGRCFSALRRARSFFHRMLFSFERTIACWSSPTTAPSSCSTSRPGRALGSTSR